MSDWEDKFKDNFKGIAGFLFAIPFLLFFLMFFFSFFATAMPINIYRSFFERFEVSGTVERIGMRFASDTQGSLQKAAMQIRDASGQVVAVSCDDTRCTTVEVNDEVTLNCYKQFHFRGAQEIECRWGEEYLYP